MASKVRELFDRYVQALATLDLETLEQLVHPDVVMVYPQSGERFRGFASFKAQFERYPGGQPASGDVSAAKLLGDDERWVITPGYTVLPLASAQRYTTVARTRYPDGSNWWVVSMIELKDDQIYSAETYFAPDFEAPEWRRELVDHSPRDG